MTRETWLIANVTKCPYCGGRLERSKRGRYQFDCTTCDRGWKIDEDGTWNALYDAAHKQYSKREVLSKIPLAYRGCY